MTVSPGTVARTGGVKAKSETRMTWLTDPLDVVKGNVVVVMVVVVVVVVLGVGPGVVVVVYTSAGNKSKYQLSHPSPWKMGSVMGR